MGETTAVIQCLLSFKLRYYGRKAQLARRNVHHTLLRCVAVHGSRTSTWLAGGLAIVTRLGEKYLLRAPVPGAGSEGGVILTEEGQAKQPPVISLVQAEEAGGAELPSQRLIGVCPHLVRISEWLQITQARAHMGQRTRGGAVHMTASVLPMIEAVPPVIANRKLANVSLGGQRELVVAKLQDEVWVLFHVAVFTAVLWYHFAHHQTEIVNKVLWSADE